jgi:hypothetical protein
MDGWMDGWMDDYLYHILRWMDGWVIILSNLDGWIRISGLTTHFIMDGFLKSYQIWKA